MLLRTCLPLWLLTAALAAQHPPVPQPAPHQDPPQTEPGQTAQGHAPSAPGRSDAKATATGLPVHRAHLQLPPTAALDHLRQGAQRAAEASAKGTPAPGAAPRPSGAGRYVAAVLVCADAEIEAPSLFGVAAKDLLVFRVPGPFVSAEITALLEQAVAQEKLSLCVVLTHEGCASVAADQGTSTAAAALARRGEPARALAAARRLPLPTAQALLEREHLLSLSESLRAAVGKDQLRIVAATADARTQAVTWHTTRAEELPIAPVK